MPNRKNIIVAIIVGVAGAFFSAFFTNIDRIAPYLKSVFSQEQPEYQGRWIGVFRDFKPDLVNEHVITENLEVYQKGKRLTGSLVTAQGIRRLWTMEGVVHDEWVKDKGLGPFLVLNYTAAENRASLGSYILEKYDVPEQRNIKEFRGYWLGHEPDLKQLVLSPYVFSSEIDEDKIKARHKDWLQQPLYYFGKGVSK